MKTTTPNIAIIGGGISGLSAARQIQIEMPSARSWIFESAPQVGGMLRTENIDGYLVENSADMFTTNPATTLDVCRQLGHESDLISTQPVEQRAAVATPDGFCPVPTGFSLMLPNNIGAVTESELLDESGVARFLEEEHVPVERESTDESLESFAVRRFGQQFFDRLIQPLVSGIYTADPKKLSMRATLARFIDMEREHGSLIGAARVKAAGISPAEQNASGARYDLFRAPQKGMGQLVQWLIDDLVDTEIRTGCRIEAITQTEDGWKLNWAVDKSSDSHSASHIRPLTSRLGASPGCKPEKTRASAQTAEQFLHCGKEARQPRELPNQFDGVIVATPTANAAKILTSIDGPLSDELSKIETASCAVVVLGLAETQFQKRFDGFGIVVPAYLNRNIIAASFSSNKFAGRAPAGKVLIRCFIGGALQSELVDRSDEALQTIAIEELDRLLGISGQPEFTRVYRWRNAMPQYHLGHLDRVERIEQQVGNQPGLEIAGNSYRGVGIPASMVSGMEAAQRVVKHLVLPAI